MTATRCLEGWARRGAAPSSVETYSSTPSLMAKGPFTETSRVDLDSLKDSTSKSWPATERKTGRLKTGPFPRPQGIPSSPRHPLTGSYGPPPRSHLSGWRSSTARDEPARARCGGRRGLCAQVHVMGRHGPRGGRAKRPPPRCRFFKTAVRGPSQLPAADRHRRTARQPSWQR